MIFSGHMNTTAFPLSQYLERIGLSTAPKPNEEGLRQVHSAQAFSIPFENIDIHFGRPISLNSADLVEKILRQKRGGYCFELNGIFHRALKALGFSVRPHMARVLYGRPAPGGRTHEVLVVAVSGKKWLADTGFGARLRAPSRSLRPGTRTIWRALPFARSELTVLQNKYEIWIFIFNENTDAQSTSKWQPLHLLRLPNLPTASMFAAQSWGRTLLTTGITPTGMHEYRLCVDRNTGPYHALWNDIMPRMKIYVLRKLSPRNRIGPARGSVDRCSMRTPMEFLLIVSSLEMRLLQALRWSRADPIYAELKLVIEYV
jgi:arylamine N-acetyltransferase